MSSRIAIEILVIETMKNLERIQEHAIAEVTQHEKQIDDLKAQNRKLITALAHKNIEIGALRAKIFKLMEKKEP